jgi:mono/diheme cytochrome c family protein
MGNRLVQYTAVALTIIGANTARAADPRNGHEIVKRWCSNCHLVERGQKGPTTEATPFATIAKRPGFDAAKLAFFLLDPHPKMPNMQLTRSEAADISAYISTLRSGRSR